MIWIFLSITIICLTLLINKLLFTCDHTWEKDSHFVDLYAHDDVEKKKKVGIKEFYICKNCKAQKETIIKV